MKSNQTQPLPSAEQLNAHRQSLKDKISALEQQHKDYQQQEKNYENSGEKGMQDAMNSLAANIWSTRAAVIGILEDFNEIWPEPKEEEKP